MCIWTQLPVEGDAGVSSGNKENGEDDDGGDEDKNAVADENDDNAGADEDDDNAGADEADDNGGGGGEDGGDFVFETRTCEPKAVKHSKRQWIMLSETAAYTSNKSQYWNKNINNNVIIIMLKFYHRLVLYKICTIV